jgi:hypothetical protein
MFVAITTAKVRMFFCWIHQYPRGSKKSCECLIHFLKEVAWGGERTRVLSISFIFSNFTTLPLSHSGSPRQSNTLIVLSFLSLEYVSMYTNQLINKRTQSGGHDDTETLRQKKQCEIVEVVSTVCIDGTDLF